MRCVHRGSKYCWGGVQPCNLISPRPCAPLSSPPILEQHIPREELVGVKLSRALQMMSEGSENELLDLIIEKYQKLSARNLDFIMVLGHPAVGVSWHRRIASALSLQIITVGSVGPLVKPDQVREQVLKMMSPYESSSRVSRPLHISPRVCSSVWASSAPLVDCSESAAESIDGEATNQTTSSQLSQCDPLHTCGLVLCPPSSILSPRSSPL